MKLNKTNLMLRWTFPDACLLTLHASLQEVPCGSTCKWLPSGTKTTRWFCSSAPSRTSLSSSSPSRTNRPKVRHSRPKRPIGCSMGCCFLNGSTNIQAFLPVIQSGLGQSSACEGDHLNGPEDQQGSFIESWGQRSPASCRKSHMASRNDGSWARQFFSCVFAVCIELKEKLKCRTVNNTVSLVT